MRGKSPKKPARKARHRCFNEARALCAGSRTGEHPGCMRMDGFNEARALCAGSLLPAIASLPGGKMLQ